MRASGVLDAVCRGLSTHRIILFDRVPTNPSPEVTQQAIDLCRSNECNIVVAIGGGSPLDVGKITALLAPGPADLMSYLQDPKSIDFDGLPCIAVPTTSGSSSEVTPFAVTWDKEAGGRYPIAHPGLFPKVAIVDPNLAVSMPSDLAAVTGMDAFTSAFEAYWSNQAQPVSEVLALECISLYRENLELSCLQGSAESRAKCALAASLSGMAYSSARTTAPHAFGTPPQPLLRDGARRGRGSDPASLPPLERPNVGGQAGSAAEGHAVLVVAGSVGDAVRHNAALRREYSTWSPRSRRRRSIAHRKPRSGRTSDAIQPTSDDGGGGGFPPARHPLRPTLSRTLGIRPRNPTVPHQLCRRTGPLLPLALYRIRFNQWRKTAIPQPPSPGFETLTEPMSARLRL